MEVRNFIQTQLEPLMITCSLNGNVNSIPVDNAAIYGCGEWLIDESGYPYIPHLMSIEIGVGVDINDMPLEMVDAIPVIGIVTKIPESFYVEDISIGLTKELSQIIRTQIISFFDNKEIFLRLNGDRYDPRQQLRDHDWSFRIRHGVKIRPCVTQQHDLGFELDV